MRKRILLFVTLVLFYLSASAQTQKYDSLEAVITGSISIYRSKTNFYLEKEGSLHLLPPRTEKVVIVNNSQRLKISEPYKGILTHHLYSCENSTKMISKLSLDEASLIKVMNKYYECTGEKATYVENQENRKKKYLGLTVGMLQTSWDIKGWEYQRSSFKDHTGALIGAFYEIQFPQEKIGIGFELSMSQGNTNGEAGFFDSRSQRFVTNKYDLDYKLLRSRVFIDISVLRIKKSTIYIKPALNLSVMLSEQELEQTIHGEGTDTYNEFFEEKLSMGISCSAGYKIPVNDKLLINAELGIQVLDQFSKNSATSNIQARFLMGQLGIAYKLKSKTE